MSGPVIKNYSFVDIFAKADPNIDVKDDRSIDKNLSKGYLHRREVTELLDHIDTESDVKLKSDGHGGFQWEIGDQVINPNDKTNKTPFWMRRISHWFNLTFSSSYKENFKEKVYKVHDAYTAFKDNINLSQAQATASAQAQAQAQTTALAEAQAQATALAEAQALDTLNSKISDKEAEIPPVQDQLNQLDQELSELNARKQMFEVGIQTADQKIQKTTDDQTNLNTLHLRLNTYLLKGAWLEEDDKPIVQELENSIYGEGNSADQLRDPAIRAAQLETLTERISAQNQLKADIITDLTPVQNSIQEKTTARNLKQTELNTLQAELNDLKALLPIEVDEPIGDQIAEDAVENDVIELPSIEPKKPVGIQDLLAGKTIDVVTKNAINEKQDINNNPLINKKALFVTIANRADDGLDGFYEKTVKPGLKLVTALLSANPEAADTMYNKWKTGLESCADKWKAAGSEDQDIDSLTTFDTLFENIMKINDALDFLAKSNLNVTQFLANLSTLKIPKEMKFAFAVADARAEEILDGYMKDPANTDLSQLFAPDTNFHTWPKDCQFFLAVSMLKVRLDNAKSITDVDFRRDALAAVFEAKNIVEPNGLGAILGLAKSEFFFNLGLNSAAGLLPAIPPEAQRLTEAKEELRKSSPNGQLSPEVDAKFTAALQFAKNPARIAFDQEYIKVATDLRADAINAVAAKHQQKTEINLYKVVSGVSDLRDKRIELLDTEKTYLESLTNASSHTKNKNKATLEKKQGEQVINTLNFLQSISSFAVKNPTFVTITNVLDNQVMTTMREDGPLNLEVEPFIPWLQDTVLKPIIAVV